MPALWAQLDLPVLVVYGSSDFITSEADSRPIVEDVNLTHADRGELRIIERMDHYLTVNPWGYVALNFRQRRAAQYHRRERGLGRTSVD
jgi:alpha-beta hydrolase superfamily lysophospholipase